MILKNTSAQWVMGTNVTAGKSVTGSDAPVSTEWAACSQAQRPSMVRPDETMHPGSLWLSVCTVAMTTQRISFLDSVKKENPPPHADEKNLTTLENYAQRTVLSTQNRRFNLQTLFCNTEDFKKERKKNSGEFSCTPVCGVHVSKVKGKCIMWGGSADTKIRQQDVYMCSV